MLRSAAYDAYWLEYLGAHQKAGTHIMHAFGTIFGLLGGSGLAVSGNIWWGVGAAIFGYAVAIASHFLVEGNRPFAKKPLWGLVADFRLIWLLLTGRLQAELLRSRSRAKISNSA
jgi:hypothetical protein